MPRHRQRRRWRRGGNHEFGASEGSEPPQREQHSIAFAREAVAGGLAQRNKLLLDDSGF
jgi:hypothetical protein